MSSNARASTSKIRGWLHRATLNRMYPAAPCDALNTLPGAKITSSASAADRGAFASGSHIGQVFFQPANPWTLHPIARPWATTCENPDAWPP